MTVATMVTKELPGTSTVHKKRKEMKSPVATIMHPSMFCPTTPGGERWRLIVPIYWAHPRVKPSCRRWGVMKHAV